MICIQDKDHETFLRSIDFDQIGDIEYCTIDDNNHRIEWNGLSGKDNTYQYKIVQFADLAIIWHRNGELHRNNDLPTVIRPDFSLEWWVGGKRHRENDLPAIVYADGSQSWYKKGKCHRGYDRPAVVNASGHREWWVNNKFIREEQY